MTYKRKPCPVGSEAKGTPGCMVECGWQAFKDNGWEVRFLQDYLDAGALKGVNPNFYGMIESIVCSRSDIFVVRRPTSSCLSIAKYCAAVGRALGNLLHCASVGDVVEHVHRVHSPPAGLPRPRRANVSVLHSSMEGSGSKTHAPAKCSHWLFVSPVDVSHGGSIFFCIINFCRRRAGITTRAGG